MNPETERAFVSRPAAEEGTLGLVARHRALVASLPLSNTDRARVWEAMAELAELSADAGAAFERERISAEVQELRAALDRIRTYKPIFDETQDTEDWTVVKAIAQEALTSGWWAGRVLEEGTEKP